MELTPLQVVSQNIYLTFHHSHNIDLFENHKPLGPVWTVKAK